MATLTAQEITRLVELTEAAAYVDWFAAIPEAAVRRLGLRCEHLGSATALIMSEIDVPIFNRVLGLGVVEPATEELLDHITALYAPSGNNFMVHVAPASQPAELATWLEQRGIRRRDSWAKVYRGNDTPPDIHTDLRIESIGPEYAAAFARTGLTAFGMPLQLESVAAILGRPSWRNYLAFDGDTPVATALLFVRDRIGWLGYGSTLSSHRRRGAQGALMVQRLRDGIEMGCEWFVTETGEETTDNPNPSYHNMLRTGFMLAYFRPNYISMGPQSAS